VKSRLQERRGRNPKRSWVHNGFCNPGYWRTVVWRTTPGILTYKREGGGRNLGAQRAPRHWRENESIPILVLTTENREYRCLSNRQTGTNFQRKEGYLLRLQAGRNWARGALKSQRSNRKRDTDRKGRGSCRSRDIKYSQPKWGLSRFVSGGLIE